MSKTIESIWEKGFLLEDDNSPQVLDNYFNKKSVHLVDSLVDGMKREVKWIIPATIVILVFNYLIGNDQNIILWSVFMAIPMLVFYVFGKRQITDIENIDFGNNCYDYLLSINAKLREIARFNKLLTICTIPAVLLPTIVFTFYKQQGKTIGEVFGVDGMDWSLMALFLLIPILSLAGWLLAEMAFKRTLRSQSRKIDLLVRDMDELRDPN